MPEESTEIHIASFIIHFHPRHRADLEQFLAAGHNLDAEPENASDQGKWVVVCEETDAGAVLDQMAAIEALPGVFGCSLVYHEVMSPQEADQRLIV